MKYIFSLLFSILAVLNLTAQDLNPVTWTYDQKMVGDQVELRFIATIEDGWYLYAQEIAENGPIPTSFSFNKVRLDSPTLQESSTHLVQVYDEMFGMELKKYKESVVFTALVSKPDGEETIQGFLEFMCCNSTQCLPPKQIDFTFNLKQ